MMKGEGWQPGNGGIKVAEEIRSGLVGVGGRLKEQVGIEGRRQEYTKRDGGEKAVQMERK